MRIELLFGIAFAAAVLAVTPPPLVADEVSVTQSDFFSEAGTAELYFTVNPDGSLSGGPCIFGYFQCGIATSAPLNWDLDVTGQCCFPEGNLSALDFPALPAGATITSATFSWTAGAGYSPFPGLLTGVEGSLGLQSVDGPCGLIMVSSPSGICSFTPASTGETLYYPDFSGGGGATAVVAEIPFEPGFYTGGGNASASATFTVTVDYSTTPEPRTYALLIGVGMAGLFAFKARLQQKVG